MYNLGFPNQQQRYSIKRDRYKINYLSRKVNLFIVFLITFPYLHSKQNDEINIMSTEQR